ncbi:MAG: CDGSH iron-sulfur domain-containing protein [candidate division Zixibacteria bacterium]
MNDPKIADRSPAILKLEPGQYWWCACGRSKNQPFCDGSHQGTEFTPHEFTVTQTQRIALCRCKRTNNKPLCDGSHRKLPPE